jgi:hypothetical protein
MKVKVDDLTENQLDFLAAQIEGIRIQRDVDGSCYYTEWVNDGTAFRKRFHPSTNWLQGGPIIEREKIQLRGISSPGHRLDGMWLAQYGLFRPTLSSVGWTKHGQSYAKLDTGYYEGSTLLIAAMRCFVAFKLGEDVEI